MNNVFINIWLTFDCNFSCTYCYEKKYKNFVSMDINTAKEVVSYLRKKYSKDDEFYINFHGGEPLLNFEAMRYIVYEITRSGYNVHFGTTTNGSLLTYDIIQFLVKYFDFGISISIDGTKNTHILSRKSKDDKDHYQLILSNALFLNDCLMNYGKNPVRIRMTVDKNNYKSLSKNVIYFYEMGFNTVVPSLDFMYTKWTLYDENKLQEEFQKIRSYELENNIKYGVYWSNPAFTKLSSCRVGENYFNISPNGDFYPCTVLCDNSEYKIGNIIDGMDTEKVKLINEKNEIKVSKCVECDLYDYCLGTRCKLINYAVNNDIYIPCMSSCMLTKIKSKII